MPDDELAGVIEEVVRRIVGVSDPQRIILFGSHARGDCGPDSDLDILVVIDSDLDFVTRTADLARQLRAGVDLDLLAYTPQEMECISHRPFIQHVLKIGKVVYERRSTP